ncbi:DUF4321 domain-containing protein [Mitsuokella sp. AF33-22]|uniref:DUF4321 domain-containing protein n=1 Tax=Mitsuokella sp. AF33-22 TaxID=2292047 RepID=UPI001F1D9513|nr:DUF4321 domain-containing protein [Mitsuokella sp. AF33-22]
MSRFGGRGYGMCILFIVIGAVLGGMLGELLKSVPALSGVMPSLTASFPIFAMESPVTIDLYVIRLTLALSFTPNIMSMLGIIVAVVLYRKYC